MRFILPFLLSLWALSAQGAVVVTNIGTANGKTGATIAITLGGGVSTGSLIVVAVTEKTNTASDGTIADSSGNTYTPISHQSLSGTAANGFLNIYYVKNATALVSTNTITYTRVSSGAGVSMSAFFATGIDTTAPLDTAVTAAATGSSTSPSATSGTPAVAGELFACGVGFASATFTQDAGDGWATPFVDSGDAAATTVQQAGGNLVNAGTGTKVCAPTLNATKAWADLIVGFKPAAVTAGGRLLTLGVGG